MTWYAQFLSCKNETLRKSNVVAHKINGKKMWRKHAPKFIKMNKNKVYIHFFTRYSRFREQHPYRIYYFFKITVKILYIMCVCARAVIIYINRYANVYTMSPITILILLFNFVFKLYNTIINIIYIRIHNKN